MEAVSLGMVSMLYDVEAVLYCTVQYCTVLYCTVLYCTVLYRVKVRRKVSRVDSLKKFLMFGSRLAEVRASVSNNIKSN